LFLNFFISISLSFPLPPWSEHFDTGLLWINEGEFPILAQWDYSFTQNKERQDTTLEHYFSKKTTIFRYDQGRVYVIEEKFHKEYSCQYGDLEGSIHYPKFNGFDFKGKDWYHGSICELWEDLESNKFYTVSEGEIPIAISNENITLNFVDFVKRHQDPRIFEIPKHLQCIYNQTDYPEPFSKMIDKLNTFLIY